MEFRVHFRWIGGSWGRWFPECRKDGGEWKCFREFATRESLNYIEREKAEGAVRMAARRKGIVLMSISSLTDEIAR